MVFRQFSRYVVLVVMLIIVLVINYYTHIYLPTLIAAIIALGFVLSSFGTQYVIEDDTIIKRFFFISLNRLSISEIKKIESVTVKKVTGIYIYIGKQAKETKENGCYLILKDDSKVKVDSQYRNKNGITLGKYLRNQYKIKYKSVEVYKLFNDRF